MKKKGLCTIAIAALMVVFLTSSAFALITGSKHDFSGETWNPGGEICVVCHTPHTAQADRTTVEVPLWNHTTTATASFTLYTSPSGTLDATMAQPAGVSKACLSCHDGTVALDAFGGAAPSPGTFIPAGALLDTNLNDDHPVSFTFDAALSTADGELEDPTVKLSGLTPAGTIDDDMLINNKLECASCHDVHNGSGINKLLVKSNAASALCLTCHAK